MPNKECALVSVLYRVCFLTSPNMRDLLMKDPEVEVSVLGIGSNEHLGEIMRLDILFHIC